jgi:SnoaL-like domain
MSEFSYLRTARHSSVESLLDAFHAAAAEASIDNYFGCFYGSNSRFLGTDASENWSAVEFYQYSKPHFDRGSGWTYVPRTGSRKIEELCTSPLAASSGVTKIATFDELLDSQSFIATSRGSGTAVYDTELSSWFIQSYHLSFPTPNDIANEICSKIAAYEKKENAAALTRKADAAAAELLAELELEDKKASGDKGSKSNGKKKGGKR